MADADRVRSRSASPRADEARPSTVEEEKLAGFRERYPVDDRAFDFLAKQPSDVQATVITDFRPREEGQSDYSALLTNFVRRIQARLVTSRRPAPSRGNQVRWRDVRQTDSREPRRRHDERRRRRRGRSRRRARASSADEYSSGSDGEGSYDDDDRDKRLRDMLRESSSDGGSDSDSDASSRSCSLEDEARARKKAEYICARSVAAAQEEEQRKCSVEEEQAMKAAGEQVARVITVEDAKMKEKLKEYEEILNSDKMARIAEATKIAEAEARDRIQKIKEEAEAVRLEKVQKAEAELEETLRVQKEEREQTKAKRQKAKEEKAKTKEEKGSKEKSKEKKTKRRKDSGSEASPKRERRRRRRMRRMRGRRVRRSRSRDYLDSLSCDRGRRRRDRDLSEDSVADASRRGRGGDGTLAHRESTELLAFRDRYPMDDRAWGALCVAGPALQKQLISQFKPRSEGDSDYSALISSFLRALLLRKQQSRPPPSKVLPRGGSRDREFSGRMLRDDGPRAIEDNRNNHADDDSDMDRSRSRSRGRDRDSDRNAGHGLEAFRDRYPMDERAFENLKAMPSEVQTIVISDFRPRKEGEGDYSALVMAFARSVQTRMHTNRPQPAGR